MCKQAERDERRQSKDSLRLSDLDYLVYMQVNNYVLHMPNRPIHLLANRDKKKKHRYPTPNVVSNPKVLENHSAVLVIINPSHSFLGGLLRLLGADMMNRILLCVKAEQITQSEKQKAATHTHTLSQN